MTEGPCFLACSPTSCSAIFYLPVLSAQGLVPQTVGVNSPLSIINQENAPQDWLQTERSESVFSIEGLSSQMTLPFSIPLVQTQGQPPRDTAEGLTFVSLPPSLPKATDSAGLC